MMGIQIDWVFLAAAAFGVVGALEYIKGFFPNVPSIAWRIISPLVCFGVCFVAGGTWQQIGINSILILAGCQLGYQAIIEAGKVKLFGGSSGQPPTAN
jgi:ABC-type sugar transport system permease subunit